MNSNIKNFELIEINILTGLKYFFPQTPTFQGKKITAIEVLDISKVATTPQSKANLNANAMKNAFLTLDVAGKEKVKQYPLANLITSNNNGILRKFDNPIITATKSFIEFTTSSNFAASGTESVLIGIHFED